MIIFVDLTVLKGKRRRADALRNEAKVRAAADIVFRRLGEDLSMDEVAREAGVSKGTVYNVFESRDQLVEELTVGYLEAATSSYRKARAKDDLWQGLVDAILTPTMGIAATAEVMALDDVSSKVGAAYIDCRSALDELLDMLKQLGIVRPEISTAHLTTLFRGLYQVLPSYGERNAELAAEYGSIILRGIRAGPRT
jgi:AcrR family transcriptional regulator